MVTVGPHKARGGRTTFTREPSGKRVSQMGFACIDLSSGQGYNPLNHIFQPSLVLEFLIQLPEFSVLLNKNILMAVNHNFCNRIVRENRIQKAEAADRAEDLPDYGDSLLNRTILALLYQTLLHNLLNAFLQLFVQDLPKGKSFHNILPHFLNKLLFLFQPHKMPPTQTFLYKKNS